MLTTSAPVSGQAGQRLATVEGDHVAQGCGEVDRLTGRTSAKVGVGAVQVADDALGVVPVGVRTQIGLPGQLERGQAGLATALCQLPDEAQVAEHVLDGPDPQTSPWPGTIVFAAIGATTSSSTWMDPDSDPISTNGVPPANTRSPVNKAECSGIQTIESLVVCAGLPTCRTSQRTSSTQRVTPSEYVRDGGSRSTPPRSNGVQKTGSRHRPASISAVRVRSCATIVASRNSELPCVWSPW